MTLFFNITYKTRIDERLILNIVGANGNVEQHDMHSGNCRNWVCDINITSTKVDIAEYFYSVMKGNEEQRQEWRIVPHKIDLTDKSTSRCIIYDRWIDTPEDAYKYSCAFTDCVNSKSNNHATPIQNYVKTLRLKVRCPQLGKDVRLALVGDGNMLGNWNPDNAIGMEERQPNEWVLHLDASKLEQQRIYFKFVAISANGTPAMWEVSQNRFVDIPDMKDGDLLSYELEQAFFPICDWKGAGTVIPVFSLRSEGSFGIGDFGDLKLMIDWMVKTNQRILQLLPINDTTINHTWTDSYPYNSISIYALHPQYTDLRQLPMLKDEARREHYEKLRIELNALPQIDYERVNNAKMEYLHELYEQEKAETMKGEEFKTFFEKNRHWLVPYAAFCHYRDLYGTATFSRWPDHHTLNAGEQVNMGKANTAVYKKVAFWYFVQFNLDKQMRAAHEHARRNQVILKGDIPIGISRDGVEAWVEPKYFNLNGQAGAPPDAFSVNGQNWGFPTYNWDAMLADGCSWWVRRFRKMSEYFDAYRIDHVLGFFRIWEIPIDAVHGLLGQFSPSLGMTVQEIENYGLHFLEDRFTRPFITDWTLQRMFGDKADAVKKNFLEPLDEERYKMKEQYDTQRKVEEWYKSEEGKVKSEESAKIDDLQNLRDGLYALISDVLFLHDRKNPQLYHPRIGVQMDFIYESLWDTDKRAFNNLYNDYFYRRNNEFWYKEAMKKLPSLTQATRMLVCAEDLGMVPDCVPWVMNELKILSLEIQSMPKDDKVRFGNLATNPYRSVCTISTHDMSTLRQWWDEDYEQTQAYYNTVLYRGGAAPHPLPGWLARDIVTQHLASPSMLCLLSLQDWLSIDESLRLPDQNAERINIPANPRHYWRYRMHLTIEQLLAADSFNEEIRIMIKHNGRN
ncbi:MAG: 4-alpha-glucanotransferase [Prevotella sp.]|nr:4-alpha-glucanotransferase [Prevotella sp.]